MIWTKKTFTILFLISLLSGCGSISGQSTDQVSTSFPKTILYEDLVARLTDLKAIAVLPGEGEKSGMWASYDRKSKVDSISGAFINWGANNDGFNPQFIRKEGENMVLAEMEGPGAIVRIWSANPAKGHIKIYIDGNTSPVIDLPFMDFFSTSSLPAFNYPQLVYDGCTGIQQLCTHHLPTKL